MFRKLTSSMPGSSMLERWTGSLTKNLKRDRLKLRLSLIFILLAVSIQFVALINPSEQARANSNADIVPGGISSVAQLFATYDTTPLEKNDFHNLLQHFGITKDSLSTVNNEQAKVCTDDNSVVTFSRRHIFDSGQGEMMHEVSTSNGAVTFYSTPLSLLGSQSPKTCYGAFIGTTSKGSWFAIMSSSGDLVLRRDTLAVPHARFTSVSCTTVQGYAYDGRYLSKPVKVYLFLGGPPGKGTPYGPTLADENNLQPTNNGGHGFHFSLPSSLSSGSPVWGVVQPMPDWNEPLVQFENTITIPPTCSKSQSIATVVCESITHSYIEQTKIKLAAKGYSNDKAILGYYYRIKNSQGRETYNKKYNVRNTSSETEPISIKEPGDYVANVAIITADGDVSSPACTQKLTITALDRCLYSNDIAPKDSQCQPCKYDLTIWSKDPECVSHIAIGKTVRNLTQNNLDANNTIADANDRIEYTLSSVNLGNTQIDNYTQEDLSNVMDYASLVDNGSGKFDNNSKTISWDKTTLAPRATDTKKIVVEVNSKIPSTPRAVNDPAAYSCSITNTYGNTISIWINCPTEKLLANLFEQLPHIDTSANLIIDVTLLLFITYFYVWKQQRYKKHLQNKGVHHRKSSGEVQGELLTLESFWANQTPHKFLSATSTLLSVTIARSTSLLFGAILAFLTILVAYVLAKHLAFALSGVELLGGFLIGWLLGASIDSLRFLVSKIKP